MSRLDRACEIADCVAPVHCRSLCAKHYQRLRHHGDPLKTVYRAKGEGTLHIDGYWSYQIEGRAVMEHVLVVERALGKRLPKGAIVHHFDGDRLNNANDDLIVCPDNAYHMLLHARQRAYEASGHADWLRCQICGGWSPPSEIRHYLPSNTKWHAACWKMKYGKERKRA